MLHPQAPTLHDAMKTSSTSREVVEGKRRSTPPSTRYADGPKIALVSSDTGGLSLDGVNRPIQGTRTGLSYSGGYTAEWTVEDDTDGATNTINPFANFGTVTWTDLESSFTTWSLTQIETWAVVQNGVTIATPTANSGDGFTVSYTGS